VKRPEHRDAGLDQVPADPYHGFVERMGSIVNKLTEERSATSEARQQLLGQSGCVLWLTGLPASGKSTIAFAAESHLTAAGRLCFVLDGDRLRSGLNSDLGFARRDRAENVRRAAEVAALLADAGLIVLVALISPYREDRKRAQSTIGPGRFMEIFVDTPLEECERRDPKGLYRRARSGELPEFTGVSAPYEQPRSPDLVISTQSCSVDAAVEQIRELLEQRALLATPRITGISRS
jgi:adenylyl-sulfate kinase